MSERELKQRLERIVDQWINAQPGERARLIREKIRLEEMLEQTRREAQRA
jgi:hypothetical protein